MLSPRSPRRSPLLLGLLVGLFCLSAAASPAEAQRVKTKGVAKNPVARASATARSTSSAQPNRQIKTDLKLKTVVHEGKEYIRTYRVTSQSGLKRLMDKGNSFRFFGGGGQYGEALYLFANRKDANKFSGCMACDTKRNVLAEVLLPKDMFKSVKKSMVLKTNDWGQNPKEFNQVRLASHILYGRWSPSPHVAEPAFEPMNGTYQLAIRQLGMPSILHKSIIREAQ